MEIGNNKFPDQSRAISDCNLLIHLRLDGVSILITDHSNNDVLGLLTKSWLAADKLSSITKLLDDYCSEQELLVNEAASVQYFLSLPKFTLIPDILYQQGSGSVMLSKTCKLQENDHVFSDFLGHRDSVLIYALEEDFFQHLKNSNSVSQIAHNAYTLNALSLKLKEKDDLLLLMISDSFAELLITRHGKLIFYNQFPHDVPEDLLYYLLFVLEQNRILAPEAKLQLISQSKADLSAYKTMLTTYIGSVEDLPLSQIVQQSHQYSQVELRAVSNMLALL